MIEVVSYPKNLADWDEEFLYLELFGETSPVVDMNFAEVLHSGPAQDSPQDGGEMPIYEYWWTIGHSGARKLKQEWEQLLDPAANVFLYFPINKGWRIKELAATVKYLTPFHEQMNWLSKGAQDLKAISPVISDISSIAKLLPVPALSGAASIISSIARLQINSVPQVNGFTWSVSKITSKSEEGILQGIKWSLPKKMFIELGDRLTGSVAVSFIPAPLQQEGVVRDRAKEPVFWPGLVLARCELHMKNEKAPLYVPPAKQGTPKTFIGLQVAPYAWKQTTG